MEFRMAIGHETIGGNALHEKDVATYRRAVADDGITTQDGCVGIDDYIVFNRRMTFDVLYGAAVFVEGETLCAEGNPLIDFHVIADSRSFSDDDSGGVVYEESVADFGSGMDINAGLGMCPFTHYARYDGYIQPVEFMCQSV